MARNKRQQKKWLKRHNIDVSDTWNLDHTMACYILPKMEQIRWECTCLSGSREMDSLDKLVKGFSYYVEDEVDRPDFEQVVQEGLLEFVQWMKQPECYGGSDFAADIQMEIVRYILPRLKLFRRQSNCYPTSSWQEWIEILDKMVKAFMCLADQKKTQENTPDHTQTIEEGLDLFAEWYGSLWW